MNDSEPGGSLDFQNTEIAYASKTDSDLKQVAHLFRLMNSKTLVGLGSSLGLTAVKLNLPFAIPIIRKTLFKQFVGGENLLDCQKTIDFLYRNKALTILDYGAESKSEETELDHVRDETMRAIQLAASNNSVPAVSTKLTGLVKNEILESLNEGIDLTDAQLHEYGRFYDRIDAICKEAHDHNVSIFIDAEESWMQIAMDKIVDEMMEQYNKRKVTVWNTFQLYRHDKLEFLKSSHEKAIASNYMLGAKLVRGAYMDKERTRAKELSYQSPIHNDKAGSDKSFNEAIFYCVENYETIGSCCASHNLQSSLYQAELIEENQIDKKHPHLNFCQLYGMSDNITFNLANAGYNVAKYVPYGPVKEVIPYLIRRARENSAVTGDMSRELSMVVDELKRRGLK